MRGRVSRWGNSLALRLPRELASGAAVAEGTEVDIRLEGGRIVLEPRPPVPSLEALVGAITPENRHDEIDWGEVRGREAW